MDLGILIAVLALGIGFIAVLKLPRKAFTAGSDPELEARVGALEQQIANLSQRLEEAQERLDFMERALGRAEETRRLTKGE